jgi:hypothetical protein
VGVPSGLDTVLRLVSGRQQDGIDEGTFAFRRDYRNLFRSHPMNTFLIKASYWFSL